MPFLRNNPALKRLEEICKKDSDYMTILNHIRASKSFRDLPPSSEWAKMGGEWAKLRVLDEFEIVVLEESSSVSKIFPPVAYRAILWKNSINLVRRRIPSSSASVSTIR